MQTQQVRINTMIGTLCFSVSRRILHTRNHNWPFKAQWLLHSPPGPVWTECTFPTHCIYVVRTILNKHWFFCPHSFNWLVFLKETLSLSSSNLLATQMLQRTLISGFPPFMETWADLIYLQSQWPSASANTTSLGSIPWYPTEVFIAMESSPDSSNNP